MHNNAAENFKRPQMDKVGIFCSGACLFHCFSAPIIVLISPVLFSYFENEWIHIFLLTLIIPIALIAFFSGYNLHRRMKPALLGVVGIFILLMPFIGERLSELEGVLTFFGCAFLILGHYNNLRYQKVS